MPKHWTVSKTSDRRMRRLSTFSSYGSDDLSRNFSFRRRRGVCDKQGCLKKHEYFCASWLLLAICCWVTPCFGFIFTYSFFSVSLSGKRQDPENVEISRGVVDFWHIIPERKKRRTWLIIIMIIVIIKIIIIITIMMMIIMILITIMNIENNDNYSFKCCPTYGETDTNQTNQVKWYGDFFWRGNPSTLEKTVVE